MGLEWIGWRVLKAGGVVAASLLLSNCGGGTLGKKDTNPQVFKLGDKVPQGGGVRKTGSAYKIKGRWYQPTPTAMQQQVGVASWYGEYFHGRKTANGEWYDMDRLSAAHPTMPLPSYVRVTNLENRRSVVVRVNDRGPYASDRVIDMSRAAAAELGFVRQGTARVSVKYIGEAPLDGDVRDMQFVDGGVNRQRRRTVGPIRRGKPKWTASAPEQKPAAAPKRPAGKTKTSPLADQLLISGPLLNGGKVGSAAVPTGARVKPLQKAAALASAPQRLVPPRVLPVPPAPVASQESSFFVQAASFSKLQRAETLSETLDDLGLLDILPVEIGTDTFYRVRLGPFRTKKNAKKVRDAVAARGHDDAQILAR